MTGRRLLAGLLGVALGSLPIAPPEHVHEAAAQSHPHLIVHRHGELHPALGRSAAGTSRFDDDDGPVVALIASIAISPSPFVAVPPPESGAALAPPAPCRLARRVASVEHLNHGPPRAPTAPRAPPIAPAA